jgi:hypothetical protein
MLRRILVAAALAFGLFVLAAFLWIASYPRPKPETPLAAAAERGSPQAIRSALAAGERPDAPDRHGWTPMVWAVRNGRADSVRLLVAAGADPDRPDEAVNGWTPLLHAVHKNQVEAVRALLAAGAEVDRSSPGGMTPLMLAANQGEPEIVEVLLAAGADPYAHHGDQAGDQSVWSHALMGGDPRVIADIRRAAPDAKLGDGWQDRLLAAWTRLRGRSRLLARADRELNRRMQ